MLTSALILLAIALVFVVVEMTLAWLVARKLRNNGIVDVVWSAGFAPLALLYFFLCPTEERAWDLNTRWASITTMVAVWSLRLGSHLFVRVRSHHPHEDVRYAKLREEWGAATDRKMFGFFQLQGALQVVLSLPVLLVIVDGVKFAAGWGLGISGCLGVAFWTAGLLGESLADRQLARFRADPANKGKVCQTGLWNYSRHPNYFFEWLVWVGYAVFALGSPWGWLGLIAPALMLHFLLNVTGIPMTEELSLKSKGDAYRAYQRTTSAFVPWCKRKAESNKLEQTVDWEGRWRLEDERLLSEAAALWPQWQAMKPSLRRLWVRLHVGGMTSDELADWAGEALGEGLESPSLFILAGLNPNDDVREARDYFDKCLRELGWKAPTREPTLIMHAADVAAALLADTIGVNAAITELYNVMEELSYARFLSGWYSLDEARLQESYNHMDEASLTAAAKREAKEFLTRIGQVAASRAASTP